MGRKLTYEELKQRVKKLEKELAERKRAEKDLRTSEERWRSLVEDAPNLIFVVDRKGTIQSINHTVSGIKPEDVIGKNHLDYVPPKYHKMIRKSVGQVFKTGKPASYEIRGVGPDNTISWYTTQLGPVKCGNKVVAVSVMPTDITERKQAENHLRKSEDKYKTLADSSLTGVFIHQGKKYVFVNNRFAQMHGYTPEELLKKDWLTLIHPDERKALKQLVSGRLKGEAAPQQYEVRRLRKDRKTIWCEMMATRIEYEGRPAIMGNIIDITERKQAEEALRESEEKVRALLNAPTDSALLIDKEGTILAINETGAWRLGEKPDKIVGLCVYDLLPPSLVKPRKAKAKKVFSSRKPLRFEDEHEGRTYDHNLYPVFGAKGKVVQLAIFARDVTAERQMENALREREATLKAKTRELSETNSALRVLLKQRAKDKTELENKVLLNVNELVVPYVEKLIRTRLDARQKAYLKVLQSNLNDIISPFAHRLSSKYLSLTPTELEIAHLIKDGKSTKDIAELLSLSGRTVESHRQHIRMKIGIKHRKVNLRSHLLSA